MNYNGNSWVNVGNAGFSSGTAANTNLAFSPINDVPYIAYEDGGYFGKITVMKYDYPTGINERQASGITLYPNPTTNLITIDVKGLPINLIYIEIEDLKGIRIFETQTSECRIVLDVENYPAGIYIVKIKTEGLNWIGKFCKD
jgi:hypothetical protein